ncbi:UDP-N-acetylmuramoylalanyl-D-glutamyl-2,6-diaminopimelate--D-alanyl-D-alanine ligase [Oceaniovalibus guishaninsula JLT2003]|uniref:UDP-N-acetylmuramoyl-tripeptide--D-alanyl-D-alanine ligase n=1 Tax=Oceaniovalibus guishaninsula JLT2003 TaxID=1231392 RepID=K2GRS2_9RHOB|nr:UDP-N-acetylmuramoyl-tripeptide--D-alanyl-D-alanine ligase [Oceaniovalibus guishaninsula]EKE45336.1 UDP-N-acetylmuramoylalanyl-D-glutamyl-2,6-diaminopimelate--D-alanyl-D-alanine ligase [Oceaniovalibus guishaninsula JLT2003]
MTPLWTGRDAAAATGGDPRGGWAATGVSIDTRTLQPGDLFVALADRRDGHDFVARALAAGAAAAMVSRIPDDVAPDAPLLVVPDVLAGLTALGRAGRDRMTGRVVAITGSVGKTSTKDMARAAFAPQMRVHAAEASYNNHWGVPLTLARMPADAQVALVEIGMNHPGEIAPLSRLARPHAAIVTTVGAAHLEAFEDLDGIAREKAAIFAGLKPGGTAIFNADIPAAPILRDAAQAAGARLRPFGHAPGSDPRIVAVTPVNDLIVVEAEMAGHPLLCRIGAPGRHLAHNAMAVLAAAEAVGADPVRAAIDLAHWTPGAGRGVRERVVLDPEDGSGIDLIDDAFNANPASMAAALDTLLATKPAGGRRMAILGDMLELGRTERDLHAAIARHPGLDRIDVIHCAGPRMHALWSELPGWQRGEWHDTAAEMAGRASALMRPGDLVLVKGSKGARTALVVDAIRKLGQSRPRQD